MQALTICQPYAELIAQGEKYVENRVWETPYRGTLLIHAGKSGAWLNKEVNPPRMDFGAIIAICELVDCVRYRQANETQSLIKPPRSYEWLEDYYYAEGPWCWILESVRRLPEPVTCDGKQGLWNPTPGTMARIEVQLAELRRIEAAKEAK